MFANSNGQITYSGMQGYIIASRIAGREAATRMALAHNAHFIQRMMKWGITILDYGIDVARAGGRSAFYAMESGLVAGYEFLETMFFWGGFR